jgi:hypothetical protein
MLLRYLKSATQYATSKAQHVQPPKLPRYICTTSESAGVVGRKARGIERGLGRNYAHAKEFDKFFIVVKVKKGIRLKFNIVSKSFSHIPPLWQRLQNRVNQRRERLAHHLFPGC